MYETDGLLAQYLLLHYGEGSDVVPWSFGPMEALDYPKRCVTELVDPAPLSISSRGLDVGCAVGRSSFELARLCGEVVGIDLSRRFIATATQLREHGRVRFPVPVEGEIHQELEFHVPAGIECDRVTFEVGDACELRADLGKFDVVVNANLIDRVPDPRRFLSRMSDTVAPGGQLILSSPFTWMEEYAPRDQWLGGTVEGGVEAWTWDGLCEALNEDFELVFDADMPFLIREHARKFQWSVARAGRWIRRF